MNTLTSIYLENFKNVQVILEKCTYLVLHWRVQTGINLLAILYVLRIFMIPLIIHKIYMVRTKECTEKLFQIMTSTFHHSWHVAEMKQTEIFFRNKFKPNYWLNSMNT